MPTSQPTTKTLPDVQSETDFRGRSIQKVGVSNIRFPFSLQSSTTAQSTIGMWQMYVSLAENKRGTHMSRFMEILSSIVEVQTVTSLVEVCEQMQQRLGADDAFLKVDFPWFVEKTAPVSKSKGKLDFDVQVDVSSGTTSDCVVTIKVPATSLCPCSKKISEFGAHNQRCEIAISVRFAEGENISLEELFQIAEDSASAQVYSVIKRDDEKQVTEAAYENPKFVEDTVRDLADVLERDARISWYRCSSENFESIHNHDAFAQIESDKRFKN
jgi:GTP cyclohydrolase I